MATEYGKRLRQARKHAKLTQVKLSELTKIPQSTISTAEREGAGSAETPVYAKACGVDALWLATGEGEMLAQTITATLPRLTAQIEASTGAVAATFSPQAQDIAKMYDAMTDERKQRRALMICIQMMQEDQWPEVKETDSPSKASLQSSGRRA